MSLANSQCNSRKARLEWVHLLTEGISIQLEFLRRAAESEIYAETGTAALKRLDTVASVLKHYEQAKE